MIISLLLIGVNKQYSIEKKSDSEDCSCMTKFKQKFIGKAWFLFNKLQGISEESSSLIGDDFFIFPLYCLLTALTIAIKS